MPSSVCAYLVQKLFYRAQRFLRIAICICAIALSCKGGIFATANSAESSSVDSYSPCAPPSASDKVNSTDIDNEETIVVSKVTFTCNTSIGSDELHKHIAPFLGIPLRPLQLEQLRQSVTQLYVDRGFATSGAIIPPEAFKDGVLQIRIVEGKVVETRVQGNERLREAYVTSRLIRQNEPLQMSVLEERMRLLLTDPLFEQINARLLPGPTLGTAILDVTVKRQNPYGLSLSASNYQAPAVGSSFAEIDGWVRNLTTWGDTLSLSVRGNESSNGYDLGWAIPVLGRSTMINLRYSKGASSVTEEPLDALDIDSRVTTKEIGISYPFIDTARRRLATGLTFGERENRTTLLGEPFSFVAGEQTGRTVVRDWRWHQEFLQRFDKHAISLRSTFTWGKNNVNGEPPVDGQPSSNFSLWLGQVQTVSSVFSGTAQVVTRATYQHSANVLVPLERLSLGGRYSVRGYRENQLVRDNGYNLSAELHYPLVGDDQSKRRVTLIPFVDLGGGKNRDAESEQLASAGLGLNWRFARFEGELFYGKRLKTPKVNAQGDLQDHGIHIQLRFNVF